MPDHYDAPDTESPPSSPKKESKPKASSGKMSDAQKKALTKHMDKVGKDRSASEKRSHRFKMMSRRRKGISVAKAHKDIMKK